MGKKKPNIIECDAIETGRFALLDAPPGFSSWQLRAALEPAKMGANQHSEGSLASEGSTIPKDDRPVAVVVLLQRVSDLSEDIVRYLLRVVLLADRLGDPE